MTICIAALCDSGNQVVFALDRMVTGQDYEYEQDLFKIGTLSPCSVAMISGVALYHTDLLRNVEASVGQRAAPTILEIVETVKTHFVNLRRQLAEERFLKPIGLDIEGFLTQQGRLNETLALRLSRSIEEARLRLEMIVAGVDREGGHIYHIGDPGISHCFDVMGFCTIGSGEHHAGMTLIRNKYSISMPLKKVAFLAYQAKKEAEIAPGVGTTYTDVGIIGKGGVVLLEKEALQSLDSLYENVDTEHQKLISAFEEQIDLLPLDEKGGRK